MGRIGTAGRIVDADKARTQKLKGQVGKTRNAARAKLDPGVNFSGRISTDPNPLVPGLYWRPRDASHVKFNLRRSALPARDP